ncbi:MAG: type II toxin-antitoxin system death-on-curing family toxin [Proteobacteria bacterium]|nr:type II toxin-antitoxin system death-on-curing family toxin [Pseudomonadota bacterium]
MKKTPKWILKKVLLLLHGEILADHGGLEGLGDEGLLESALARPKNLFAHSSDVHIARLTASYCFGIIQNHPFLDGNKRTGFLSIGLFLELNGKSLVADQVEAIQIIFALAAGEIDEKQLAEWIRVNMS